MEIEISFGFAVRENELQSARGCPEDRAAMGKLGAPSGVGEPQLDREKGLKAIRRGLNVSQPELLRWSGAGLLNLYVRLTANGSSEIQFQTLSLLRTSETRHTYQQAVERFGIAYCHWWGFERYPHVRAGSPKG